MASSGGVPCIERCRLLRSRHHSHVIANKRGRVCGECGLPRAGRASSFCPCKFAGTYLGADSQRAKRKSTGVRIRTARSFCVRAIKVLKLFRAVCAYELGFLAGLQPNCHTCNGTSKQPQASNHKQQPQATTSKQASKQARSSHQRTPVARADETEDVQAPRYRLRSCLLPLSSRRWIRGFQLSLQLQLCHSTYLIHGARIHNARMTERLTTDCHD